MRGVLRLLDGTGLLPVVMLVIVTVVASTTDSSAQCRVDRSFKREYKQYPYRIELLKGDTEGDEKYGSRSKTLEVKESITSGQKLTIDAWNYTKVKVGDERGEAIIFSPSRKISMKFPDKEHDRSIEFFAAKSNIDIKRPTYSELGSYRNLAYNPYDFQVNDSERPFYPHVTSSSDYEDRAQFAVRNSIDGNRSNLGHAIWSDRSWGPEKEESSWIEIDFGRAVSIDKVSILIRADFPHDGYWRSADILFDSGEREHIEFSDSKGIQDFKFDSRVTRRVRVENLEQPDPMMWCSFTEVEVWGEDVLPFEIKDSWSETVATFNWVEGILENNSLYLLALREAFPIELDWFIKDFGVDIISFIKEGSVISKFETKGHEIAEKSSHLDLKDFSEFKGIELYLALHNSIREQSLAELEERGSEYVYVKRHRYTPSFFAYSEGLSDARSEYVFSPGGALVIMSIKDGIISERTILETEKGVIRDPDVSYDGKRILFAWKKSEKEDDYHLYEYVVATGDIKQLTYGLGYADIEGKYLPNGEIVFNSTRCGQSVDCWKVEVSNLYFIGQDGKHMRRVGYDQVHTTYPTVTEQGTIIYTRWDYNDRGQTFPQPLFSMNMDGTMQRELYGNSSWYPTTITHARQIPGTGKYMATLCGHHTGQKGKLAVIDPSKGRQENKGVTLLAPKRVEEAVRIDQYGQRGEQFQYPYPFNEDNFLISFDPINGKGTQFGIYMMSSDGERELLVSDDSFDSKQIVPLKERNIPHIRPNSVDYTKSSGVFYVQDVYYGESVEGLERGSIEKLRVVEIDFRSATVGWNDGSGDECGVGVANIAGTPIALAMGAWDVKRVLGEVDVEKDGSAMFEVPSHTPLYFQLIDRDGNVAQTMRSWSSLQPGETFGCVGCHEDKNESVPVKNRSIAMRKGVKQLTPFYGMEGGFSYRTSIQPILDKNCIECHYDRDSKRLIGGTKSVSDFSETVKQSKEVIAKRNRDKKAFSLLDNSVISKKAKREWSDSYLNLLSAKDRSGSFQGDHMNELVNWPGMQSIPTLLPIYFRGAATSKLMTMLKEGHGETDLSREELDIIACWIDLQVPYCGDYYESNSWSEEDKEYYEYYELKRARAEEDDKRGIEDYLKSLHE